MKSKYFPTPFKKENDFRDVKKHPITIELRLGCSWYWCDAKYNDK